MFCESCSHHPLFIYLLNSPPFDIFHPPSLLCGCAKSVLVRPIVVNVGRAGAANLDVIQEVEYVKEEAKIVYLLECLQKTAPPVIIFCDSKAGAR